MTLFRFITSLRRYGAKGIYDWIKRCLDPHQDPIIHALLQHCDKQISPTRGITIIGDLSSHASLNKVLRDLSQSLKDANIPHQVYDTKQQIPNDFISNRYSDIVTMFQDFRIKELSCCRQHRIVFWEFDTGFEAARPDWIDGSPLLTLSTYNYKIFSHGMPRSKVEYLRYPFHFTASHLIERKVIRTAFNIPQNAFMVFFNFDYRSSYYRKNPEGLLQAFLEAFKTCDDAVLVFKTIGSREKKEMAANLQNKVVQANAERKVIFINDFITNEELVSLTAACDVYASLHRGEGFGLGVAEAMSLGKPVVASDCGATCEFCNPETAKLVPCKTVPVKPEQIDHIAYSWIKEWPEPSTHATAVALRELYDNQTLRQQMGELGRRFIAKHFSTEEFKKSIEAILDS